MISLNYKNWNNLILYQTSDLKGAQPFGSNTIPRKRLTYVFTYEKWSLYLYELKKKPKKENKDDLVWVPLSKIQNDFKICESFVKGKLVTIAQTYGHFRQKINFKLSVFISWQEFKSTLVFCL